MWKNKKEGLYSLLLTVAGGLDNQQTGFYFLFFFAAEGFCG